MAKLLKALVLKGPLLASLLFAAPARRLTALLLASIILTILASPANAEFPFSRGGSSADPYAYENYMFITNANDPAQFPPSDLGGDLWRYSSKNACQLFGMFNSRCNPAIINNPQELFGVTGASIDKAWQTTTGRPDVIIAVHDSGVKWNDIGAMADLNNKTWLNRGELPLPNWGTPHASDPYDRNADGIFNIKDYAFDSRVSDLNANGILDPEDLIFRFSDGFDGFGANNEGNGYIDDFVGWDTYEEDNDPFDEVQFGHGTGEARDSTAEVNNGGDAGVCPNCLVMHMRVGDSFIADITDFAEGVVYATDNGASVIQSALGTLNNSRFAQEAINYAHKRGVVLIASAADESAGHHNQPSVLEHAVTVNSIGEPTAGFEITQPSYLEFRGCTNYGAYITAAVPSNSCSSEATGRTSGMAGLIYSAARNAVAKGIIADYGALDGPGGVTPGRGVSAEEVDQIISKTADDLNFVTPVLYTTRIGLPETERYPATAGWDPFFGYGRVNAFRMVQAVAQNKVPPEADITSPKWFAIIDPDSGPIEIKGTVASHRSPKYSYTLKWGMWSWRDANSAPIYTDLGVTLTHPADQTAPFSGALATIDPLFIKLAMLATNGAPGSFDGPAVDPISGRGDQQNRQFPDKFAVIVQLEVTAKNAGGQPLTNIDGDPLVGIGTKNFHLHDDPALLAGFPLDLQGDGAAAPRFADLDNDGRDELIVATSNGEVHAYEFGGGEVAGWPVHTSDAQLNYGAPAYQSNEIMVPVHAAVLRSPTIADINRDGDLEVIVGDFQGRISAFDRHGQMLPGFPVRADPAFSQPQRPDREAGYYAAHPQLLPGDYPGPGPLPNNPDLVPDLVNRKDKLNRTIWWFLASPSVGNINPSDDDLEIIAGNADRHLYAFHSDGTPVAGWPVMLRDPAKLDATDSVDPLTHRVRDDDPNDRFNGAKVVMSPAFGDIDGDGDLDVIATVNEQYKEPVNSDDPVLPDLINTLTGDVGNNRVYAIHPDGSLHGGGPPSGARHPHPNAFLSGWPARIGTLTLQLLPVVGNGPDGAPVIGNVNGGNDLEVGIFGTAGPAYILGPDGASIYGQDDQGRDKTLLMQPPGAGSNSPDTPAIPAVAGGIFTDLQGTGQLSFAAPTAGLGKLLDVVLPEDQLVSDNQLSVWDLTGSRVQIRAYPREVNDLQFLSTAASADINGDGLQELLNGSAYSDLHAFNFLGVEPGLATLSPTGWPKFTAGWTVAPPAVGDFNGDGMRDIAHTTREGMLFVWHGNGAGVCAPASWPEYGHDGWNTNNIETDAQRPRAITDLALDSVATVTGGGTIAVGSGKANFGFNTRFRNGAIDGQLLFDDHASGLRVKSDSVNVLLSARGLTLRWTAPGDDGPCGQAQRYEVRRSTSPITPANWNQATLITAPQPQPAGSPEQLILPDLAPGTYYFAVRAIDDKGNLGALSNLVTATVADMPANQAVFRGTATLNGLPGHPFTVTVVDDGEPGAGTDSFRISLAGYSAGGVLQGGNIQIHRTDQEPTSEMVLLWKLLFSLEDVPFLLE